MVEDVRREEEIINIGYFMDERWMKWERAAAGGVCVLLKSHKGGDESVDSQTRALAWGNEVEKSIAIQNKSGGVEGEGKQQCAVAEK